MSEREQFEAWDLRDVGLDRGGVPRHSILYRHRRDGSGLYCDDRVQLRWHTWQAARAAPRALPGVEERGGDDAEA